MNPLRMLWLLFALLVALPARAVELNGQLRGTVSDPTELPIPGVVVTVTSPALQGDRTAPTDADGRFHILALPPGDYQVAASLPGFNTTQATVRVPVGSTITLNLTLTLAEAGEEIIVTAESPVIDVTKTSSGATLTKEMLRDIPNASRSYHSSVSLTPGLVGSGNANVHGGYYTSNQFYLDGVNTTDPLTGTFSMNMNFDAIEEIQVITGGMDAEYGKSLGGAVNIITRSGGNEYEGSVQLLYNGTETQLYKPLPDEEETAASANQSLALNLGGPIMKDKLWFFTSLQFDRTISTPSVASDVGRPEPMQSEKWLGVQWFGKLTFRPHQDHKIWLHAQGDPTDIQNAEGDVYTLPSADTWFRQGGWLTSAGHLWTPTATTIVETQGYLSSSYIKVTPIQWIDCKNYDDRGVCTDDLWDGDSWWANDPDGFSYGPYQYAYYTNRNRYSINTYAMQLFDLLGQHQAKAGFQAEFLRSYTILPGLEEGLEYWAYSGDDPADIDSYEPYLLLKYDTDQEALLTGSLISWYVQDVYQPIPRLTLRAGVRFDLSNFMNDIGDSVFQSLTAAPRLGVAYDLTGDSRTSLHAFYGRFYDSGYLQVSDLLAKKAGGYGYYYWDDRQDDWSSDAAFSSAPNFEQHTDLLNPYSDEFQLGLTRNVGGGWGLDGTFVYKEYHSYWEDDEINDIWNAEGTEVIGYRNGTAEDIYRLRTPDEVFQNYTSVEIAANKQFDEHWGMMGSYTWSKAYGVSQGNSTGLATGNLDIPEQLVYETGIQGYDVPHNVKLAGSYRDAEAVDITDNFQLGFLAGWNFSLRSGYPYRKSYYNTYYDGWYNSGDDTDGATRLPAYSRVDLKAGVTFAVARTTWDLTAECFNVMNERTVTSVATTYDDTDGGIYTDSDGELLYGQPTSRQSPRYLQFGLHGEF